MEQAGDRFPGVPLFLTKRKGKQKMSKNKIWIFKGWYIFRTKEFKYKVYSCMEFTDQYLKGIFNDVEKAYYFIEKTKEIK